MHIFIPYLIIIKVIYKIFMDFCKIDFVIVVSTQGHLRPPSEKGFVPPRGFWRINFVWFYNFGFTLEKDVNSSFFSKTPLLTPFILAKSVKNWATF